ncbi:Uncharacterised protein [Vibrio cholerae]|nr:Uncharacterised protein [Vibrio cholerae]
MKRYHHQLHYKTAQKQSKQKRAENHQDSRHYSQKLA